MVYSLQSASSDPSEQSGTPSHRQWDGMQYVLLKIYCAQVIRPASHSGGATKKKINKKKYSIKKMVLMKSVIGNMVSTED